ncbi:MAG: DUF4136 domain-containing protein [Bacteroidales bacterium]|nr:DUF4136 domain-containing protein [Bacteroidales bacterium]
MKRLAFLLIPTLLVLSGCGNAFRVYHDQDPEAGFDKYSTYSFLDWTEGNKNTITGMELERIRTAFARELENKGLEYNQDSADLQVKITVYFREKQNYMYGYYYPHSYKYIERALAVDIFETATRKHIWHSAAVGEVGRTPEIRAEELPEQVEKMLEKYPGNSKT